MPTSVHRVPDVMTSSSMPNLGSADERPPGHPAEADTAVSAREALSGRDCAQPERSKPRRSRITRPPNLRPGSRGIPTSHEGANARYTSSGQCAQSGAATAQLADRTCRAGAGADRTVVVAPHRKLHGHRAPPRSRREPYRMGLGVGCDSAPSFGTADRGVSRASQSTPSNCGVSPSVLNKPTRTLLPSCSRSHRINS